MDGISTQIGNPARDALLAGDDLRREQMAIGSLKLLNAIERERGQRKNIPAKALPGRKLIWHDGSYGGTFEGNPLSQTAQRQQSSVLQRIQEKERVRSLAVKRDPCPMCGTRMDVGCKHRRAA